MTQDKQPSSLFDTGTLVIIFVAIVGVVLFIFVRNLSDFTASTDDSHAEYYASVEERIRPFGRVRLPGDELAPGEIRVDEVPPAEPGCNAPFRPAGLQRSLYRLSRHWHRRRTDAG